MSGILEAIHQSNSIKIDIKDKLNNLNCIEPKRDELLAKAKMTTHQLKITEQHTPYHNTHCLTCPKVCHENCNLQFTAVPWHDIFRDCDCMNKGECIACSHDHTTHAHAKFIYNRQIISKPLITEDERSQLNSMNDAADMQKYMIKKLQQTLDDNTRQINELRHELKTTLCELKDLCSHYDYKMELRCAIELLKEAKLVESAHYNKNELQNLEDYFNQLIKDFDQAQAS